MVVFLVLVLYHMTKNTINTDSLQWTVERKTQYKTGVSESILTTLKQDILDHYRVTERDLEIVYDLLQHELYKRWIHVEYRDLNNVIEEHNGEQADHIETSIADGDTVYLHANLWDHGGIATRLFDIMHLWAGHMIQRAADHDSGLEFWGDAAYEIWSVFHNGASQETLQKVRKYEEEAGRLGLFALQNILHFCVFNESHSVVENKEISQNIYRMYNDYCANDLEFIIDYYRTGKSKNFFAEWKFFDHTMLQSLQTPPHIKAKKRPMIDIGVVRDNNLHIHKNHSINTKDIWDKISAAVVLFNIIWWYGSLITQAISDSRVWTTGIWILSSILLSVSRFGYSKASKSKYLKIIDGLGISANILLWILYLIYNTK